jgi:hypothetical protein
MSGGPILAGLLVGFILFGIFWIEDRIAEQDNRFMRD